MPWAGVGLALAVAMAAGGEAPPAAEVLLAADQTTAPIDRPAFDDARADERRAMVRAHIERRGVDDADVLDALRAVPRHLFVPDHLASRAYDNQPLPIGHGQTISQPFIVGFMTAQLRLGPGDRVLEIGAGSGYHAAVLAQLADHVVTIEIVEPLARSAADRLAGLDYTNITVLHGDGYYGYPEKAPFDAIVVTAAAPHVPPPLIEQLRPGGRMVIPVGRAGWTQNLLLVEKSERGRVTTRNLMDVRFVPLTRQ